MEHDLDLSMASMERSLSVASRRYSMAMGLGMGGIGPMGGFGHGFGSMGPMTHGVPGHAMVGGTGSCVLHNNLNNIQNISTYDDALPTKVAHFTPDPPGVGRRHLTDV